MNVLGAARGLLWPAAAPTPLRQAPPDGGQKVSATWPGLSQFPATLGGAVPGMVAPVTWTPLVGDAPVGLDSWDYADLYAAQVWVYTLVNKLARGIGRLPLKVYRREQEGDDRVRERTSLLAALLADPCPSLRLSPFDFAQRVVGEVATAGNSLWLKVASGPTAVPTSLEPIPSAGWAVAADGSYAFTVPQTSEVRRVEAWRVLHFRFWSPVSGSAAGGWPWHRPGFGLSPLEPLRRTLAIESGAQQLGIAAFEHGGNMPGILTTSAKLADVEAAVQRISHEWNRRHAGVKNAYRTPVLTDDLKWQATGATMRDAAVVEHRQLTREEVCAVFDVPPPIVGILDKATYSNISEQSRWLVQHTYNIWTTMIEETLKTQLLAGVPAFAGRYAEFDTAEVLKGDAQARYGAYSQAINAGWITSNEIRRIENMPRIDDPDADRLHRPLALSPVLTAEPAPEPVPAAV